MSRKDKEKLCLQKNLDLSSLHSVLFPKQIKSSLSSHLYELQWEKSQSKPITGYFLENIPDSRGRRHHPFWADVVGSLVVLNRGSFFLSLKHTEKLLSVVTSQDHGCEMAALDSVWLTDVICLLCNEKNF